MPEILNQPVGAPPEQKPTPTPITPAPAPSALDNSNPFDADFASEANQAVSGGGETTPSGSSGDAPADSGSDSGTPKATQTPPKAQTPPPATAKQPDPAQKPPQQVANTPKQLREAYERLQTEHGTAKEQLSTLSKRLADAEAKGKDTAALAAQIAAKEKEVETLRAEVRGFKREHSPEFVEKYQKPFNDAAEIAREMITQLSVVENPEDDPALHTHKQADWKDFAGIYQLPYGQAFSQAKRLFGADVAPLVMQHYGELHKLDRIRTTAAADERANWSKRQEEERAGEARRREEFGSLWSKVNEEIVAKVEDYRDTPEDTESSSLRKRYIEVFDRQDLTPQQSVIRNAHTRQIVGAFPVVKAKLGKALARVAELEAELSKRNKPLPSPGSRAGGESFSGETEDWDAAARKAVEGA